MANLQETESWEAGIYQLEMTDPVVAGPPDLAQSKGFANVQALQLANRTLWLKAQMALLQAALGNLDIEPQIQAKIDQLIDNAPGQLNTLNELATALLDQDNALATMAAQIAALQGNVDNIDFSSQIQAAINNLVDGAPVALNTLRELADEAQGNKSGIAALVSQVGSLQTALNNINVDARVLALTNARLASETVAKQGQNNSDLMTPLRVMQAILSTASQWRDWKPWREHTFAGGTNFQTFTLGNLDERNWRELQVDAQLNGLTNGHWCHATYHFHDGSTRLCPNMAVHGQKVFGWDISARRVGGETRLRHFATTNDHAGGVMTDTYDFYRTDPWEEIFHTRKVLKAIEFKTYNNGALANTGDNNWIKMENTDA